MNSLSVVQTLYLLDVLFLINGLAMNSGPWHMNMFFIYGIHNPVLISPGGPRPKYTGILCEFPSLGPLS